MVQYCVVVTNGARARFFTLEPSEIPELQSGPNLIEHNQIDNPFREMHGDELWSEAKTGRNRAAIGGPAHGYDDHRDQHRDEYERRFANSVADECCRLSHHHKASDVVIVSQKRMLGFLRSALETRMNGRRTTEIAKDLSKLSPIQVHEHLARENLLPPRRTPVA